MAAAAVAGFGEQGLRGGTRRVQRRPRCGEAARNRGGDVRGKVGGDRRRRPFNKRDEESPPATLRLSRADAVRTRDAFVSPPSQTQTARASRAAGRRCSLSPVPPSPAPPA